MREQIEERCVRIGQYIVDTGATVRAAAAHFGVSKSSVHKDVGERLPAIEHTLATQVRDILTYHKQIRHLRGGEATRAKYLGQRREIHTPPFPYPNRKRPNAQSIPTARIP